MKTGIPYYRVSTERQGQSGLGLEAQQKAVRDYATTNGFSLLQEFFEVESGKKNKRPILLQALEQCRKQRATLLIAKLDRLGRNVAFISRLMESQVDFIALDIPFANTHANRLIVHVMAAFAEYERELICTRTRDALQAAKRRGVVLGIYGKNVLSITNKKASDDFARAMEPVIMNLNSDGFHSVRKLTHELNERSIDTFYGNGTRWHKNTVHRLLKRIESLNTNSLTI